ncbi:hypothetical protein B0A50_06607 [Salinomyces thailandicus]|uniref:TOG domain-containing protein n=1 Tax=Salinomyces thailandicus TaxID=706561 RepID=A0A4U0TRW3_9PEZI|nr:hypothetical protein B0A50_06607 [Salinomyces thailandica]
MDAQAASLLSLLKRPAAPSDAKLHSLNQLKSDIKHHRVPDPAQATIFECLRLAIGQQLSSTLTLSAYATLGHLIKRLKIQDTTGSNHALVQLAPRLFPALQERLGDMKEPVRNATGFALSELFPFVAAEVEGLVRDEALTAGNPRAKEAAMQWVVRMHRDENMPFKSYTSYMVARLEDADGTVREAAKTSLVALFSNAPDRAKTDLKRQLKAHSVRHSIATQILNQIGSEMNAANASTSRPQTRDAPNPDSAQDLGASTRSLPNMDHVAAFADSINSEAAKPPPPEEIPMDPIYVHSQRELEDTFRDFQPYFDGKETEENWMPRDKSVLKIRRLLKGNAPSDYHSAFMLGLKALMDGILKVANSLRTTMSSNGSSLVQELARTLGPAFDPHAEIVLQNSIKMSAATKPIAAQNGRAAADAVFQHCSYHARMMQHLWSAAQEKNAQTRQNVPEWLKILLRRQAGYKGSFESSGGLELAEKCLKKGLDDPKPAVKEGMRGAFWVFHRSWPERAGLILAGLSSQAKSALEKDPGNPHAGLTSILPAAPAASTSRAPGAGSRMAMREMIAEQRKAKAKAARLPDRPSSAMATLSPAKPRAPAEKSSSSSSRAPSQLRTETRFASSTTSVNSPAEDSSKAPPAAAKRSALMSGPVRRPRRPEIPRPQTADPYASRRFLRPETPVAIQSPGNSPPKASGTGASKSSIPTNSAVRNRAKTSGVGASPRAERGGSPGGSPVMRLVHGHPVPIGLNASSSGSRPGSKGSLVATAEEDLTLRSGRGEDFTMVMPLVDGNASASRAAHSPPPSSAEEADGADDGFTMVIPAPQHPRTGSQSSSYHSPLKALFDSARSQLARSASPPGARTRENMAGIDEAIEDRRTASPVKPPQPTAQEATAIEIYEDDPFAPALSDDEGGSGAGRKVLRELQVNEHPRVHSPTFSHSSSPTGSPSANHTAPATNNADAEPAAAAQDRAERVRARRLLASGITRIRSRELDPHGFRRVQTVVRDDTTALLWGEEGGEAAAGQGEELVAVLLEFLAGFASGGDEQEAGRLAEGKAAGLRAQALGLLRFVLASGAEPGSSGAKKLAAWHARILTTLYTCRGTYTNGTTTTTAAPAAAPTDLDKTLALLLQQIDPAAAIDASLASLPTNYTTANTTTSSSPPPVTTTLTLRTLRNLLTRSPQSPQDPQQLAALTCTAAGAMSAADTSVRRAGVELAADLFGFYEARGKESQGEGNGVEAYWRSMAGVGEGRLGLLSYFIARRSVGG